MTRTQIVSLMDTSIHTISGEAWYSHTEIEDKHGRWDDHWQTRNGEHVVHNGTHHDVYLQLRKVSNVNRR